MDELYKCKKGFLVTQDDDGVYIPFFLFVRDKDIVPSVNPDFPIELKGYDYELYSLVRELEPTIGKPLIKFTYNGWNVELKSDYSYEALMKVPVNADNFSTRNNNPYILRHEQKLPVYSRSDNFFAFLTMESDDSEILSVIPSYHLNLNNEGYGKDLVKSIDIRISNYHNDLMDNIGFYTNAFVNVKIIGQLAGLTEE